MKQKLLTLIVAATILLFFGCPPPQEEPTPDSPLCAVDLEDYNFWVDTTYNLQGDSVGIDLIWEPVEGAEEYVIATSPAGDTFTVPHPDTTLSIIQVLPLDTPFEAILTINMADDSECGPVMINANYCNGGGTVDDVSTVVDWDFMCGASTCDFIKFKSRDIQDCNGSLMDPLPWRLRGGKYYKRTDLCDCLTDNGTKAVCDALNASNKLNTCLNSLQACLKHDYVPCE